MKIFSIIYSRVDGLYMTFDTSQVLAISKLFL